MKNSRQRLANEIRKALGEYNNDRIPVRTLVDRLVIRVAELEQQPRAAVPDSVRDEYALKVAQRLWVLPAMPKAQLIATLQCAIRDAMDWAAPPPPAVPAGCGRNAVALIFDDNGDPLRGQRYENGEWSLRNWHAMRDDNAEAAGAVPAGGVVLDERAAFEQWMEPDDIQKKQYPDGSYQDSHVSHAWSAWKARALLSSQPQPDPVLSGPLHVIGDGQMPDKLRERIRKGQEVGRD